ncbi:MAG TPA: YIP1 family protein [Terriglobales bacterium]|jgi:hypothetical protein
MAAAPLTPTSPSPDTPPLSQGARIVNTFIAPSNTFTDLRRSAAWWAPFLLMIVVSVLFVRVVDKKVTFRRVMENQIQLSPKQADQMEKMPPEQRERVMTQQTAFWRIFSYCYPVVILIWNLIIAAILFGTFKLVMSADDLKFGASYAVVMYASLPLMIKSLLAIVFLLAGINTESFTFQNPVASNPGYFINAAESRVLYSVLTSLDIFMIWTLVLTGIGFACVSRLRRGKALGVVFGWYALFVMLGAAVGAAFS